MRNVFGGLLVTTQFEHTVGRRASPTISSGRRLGAGLAALLLLSCAPAALHAQTSNEDLAKEIAELKAQIRELRGSVSATRSETRREVQKVRAASRAPAYALPPPGYAVPAGAVPAFVTADKKLQFGAITITPGGFIEGASVFRSRSTQSDISSNFNGAPFPQNTAGHTNEYHFTARDTRIALLAEAPITPTFLAGGYVEIDFNAAASTANENQTNSYTPRMRNLYATLDETSYGLHALAGQNWSLVTLNSKGITPRNEVTPAVIDSSQHVGSLYARQPGIRLTKDFDKKLWISVALEESQTTGCPGNTITGAAAAVPGTVTSTIGSASTQTLANGITATCGGVGTGGSFVGAAQAGPVYSFNHLPDVIGKVAYEAKLPDRDVHIEALGVYTDLYDRVRTGAAGPFSNKDTTGYGIGAGIIFPVIPKRLDFQVNGIYGRGINRYGPAQLPDATFNADGSLRPIQGYVAMAGLTLHATPAIDIYSYAGIEGEKRTYTATNAAGLAGSAAGGYAGIGSPSTVNTGCFTEGSAAATCNGATHRIYEITGGFWDKLYKGSFGEVRVGASYSYLNRAIFSAPGKADRSTNDHIVFTSMRYYPFQ